MNYVVVNFLKLLMQIIYAPMKLLKTKDKVTFISRQSNKPSIDFDILCGELKKRKPNVEVVVLCKQITINMDSAIHTLKQMYHIATSKTVVLDSYSIPISVLKHKKGLTVIQMWHSMGCMKAFGFAMIGKEEGRDPRIAEILKMHQGYTYILISSMDYVQDYIDGFRTTPDKVLEIPLPKADYLSNPEYMAKLREEVLEEYPKIRGKKNILYCPTFRQDVTDFDFERVKRLIMAIDYDKYNLLYKSHPVSKMKLLDSRVTRFNVDNIKAIAVADYIISDYSSIIYEAGLAHKPVYLYAYDWDTYKDKRDLNLDLKAEAPTIFSDDPKEIVEAIEKDEFDFDSFNQFTTRNIRMPKTSCSEEIIKLMNLDDTGSKGVKS